MIVPVRNGGSSLGPLLDSLARQTLPSDQYEVVVVDNASTDDTAEVARAAGARVVSEPHPNRSRARNKGAAEARTALFAFTDADCVASPGWLEGFLGCPEDVPLVAGPILVSTATAPNAIERFEALWRFAQEDWVAQGWAATANLRVRRDAFESVGGFDPAYRHIGEDVDFCVRATRAGHELGWCAGASVSHEAERELNPMLRRFFFHGYSSAQLWYRTGFGQVAWRTPLPAFRGGAAAATIGLGPQGLEPAEWRRVRRLSHAGFLARLAGSLWAEMRRAR